MAFFSSSSLGLWLPPNHDIANLLCLYTVILSIFNEYRYNAEFQAMAGGVEVQLDAR